MSDSRVDAYLKELAENTGLQEKLQNCKTAEEALEVVKVAGFDFGLEEFTSLMGQVIVAAKDAAGAELTEDELSSVAGGGHIAVPSLKALCITSW